MLYLRHISLFRDDSGVGPVCLKIKNQKGGKEYVSDSFYLFNGIEFLPDVLAKEERVYGF